MRSLFRWIGAVVARFGASQVLGAAVLVVFGMNAPTLLAAYFQNPPPWLLSPYTQLIWTAFILGGAK